VGEVVAVGLGVGETLVAEGETVGEGEIVAVGDTVAVGVGVLTRLRRTSATIGL
jgi:hypothetical protein